MGACVCCAIERWRHFFNLQTFLQLFSNYFLARLGWGVLFMCSCCIRWALFVVDCFERSSPATPGWGRTSKLHGGALECGGMGYESGVLFCSARRRSNECRAVIFSSDALRPHGRFSEDGQDARAGGVVVVVHACKDSEDGVCANFSAIFFSCCCLMVRFMTQR